MTDIEEDYRGQYFWEAFPASSGPTDRTTYMFSYMDAEESRPTIASMLEHDYWELMPKYQNIGSIDDVRIKRVLFGLFPTYRDSPLKTEFDRVLAIGTRAVFNRRFLSEVSPRSCDTSNASRASGRRRWTATRSIGMRCER